MQEIRISLRSLLRVPGVTLTILITVGLGIGATTAIFAGVDAALLRPLPYRDPGRLVWIYTDAPPFKWRLSVADYLALEAQQTQFDRVAAYTERAMAFTGEGAAEVLSGRSVSWTYFGLLGISPALGRDFTELDGRPGSPPSIIVSHGFWQQRLGGRADVIGTAVRLDGADYRLTGVLPPATGPFERRQDFFVAAQFAPPPRRGPFLYTVMGRLRGDVSPSAAASELHAINRRIFPIWKSSYQDDKATWSLTDLRDRVSGDVQTMAALALAAVAMVWLIACANASNLLVTRAASRRRELAIRTALGASRRRILHQLLTESSLLAGGAAVLGIVLARAGIEALRTVGAGYFPRASDIALDGRVLIVLMALTLLSAVVLTVIPAVQATGGPVDEALRGSDRSSTGTPSARRLRQVLVGSQFAIATPLLVVSALLLASLGELRKVDVGFDARNVITAAIRLPGALYRTPGSVTSFWDDASNRLSALPGVAGVAFADGRPPNGVGNFNNFDLEERPASPGQPQPVTPWVAVTPAYFRVLGLSLIEGRLLNDADALRPNLESVVVDRAWARRFFPNQSALGKRFREGGCTECPWTAVVGVVSEVKYTGLEQPDQGTVYSPMSGMLSRYVIVRTQAASARILPDIRQAIRRLDPNAALTEVSTMNELVDASLDQPRSLSLLIGSLALVALALSVIGIYGVMSYYVEQHARDISIRMALGGTAPAVLRLVVGRGMRIVTAGVLAGVAAAFAVTRMMSSLLFGVGAADAPTFAVASLFLLTIALVGCVIPARRAVGLEPASVLRRE